MSRNWGPTLSEKEYAEKRLDETIHSPVVPTQLQKKKMEKNHLNLKIDRFLGTNTPDNIRGRLWRETRLVYQRSWMFWLYGLMLRPWVTNKEIELTRLIDAYRTIEELNDADIKALLEITSEEWKRLGV